MKQIDAIAIGTCYVDTNLTDYPFGSTGIAVETELLGESYEVVAGGSAVNFCRLLGGLGSKTAFIGMAGKDPNGSSLEAALRKNSVKPLLIRQDGLLTNISFNMTNPAGEHIMLAAGTANAALAPEAVLPRLTSEAAAAKTIYLGGCFKLKKLAPAFAHVADIAQQNEAALVVDHGRIPQSADHEIREAVKALVRRADYYLPSRDEFCQLWEVKDIEAGLTKLLREAPNLTAIVKDGANGAFYWDRGALRHVPAKAVDKVVNVTGAGDSFNAGVIAAIVSGRSIAEAVEYGCAVGAAKVTGRSTPSL